MKKKIFGILLQLESLFLILTAIVSLFFAEKDWWVFLCCAALSFIIGALGISMNKWELRRKGLERYRYLSRSDSFMVVALVWVIFSFIGMIPFIRLADMSVADAFFETMSGFTTTGASVISDVDSLGHGLKFWRSIIQWMGGLGIVVFTFALMPSGEMRNNNIFSAEATGISLDKFRPKIGSTARRLLMVYIILTLACSLCYYLGPMTAFDAVCHGLTTIATGGFSTHSASIAYFHSPYIEYVASIFMLLASLNYGLYYYAFIRRWYVIRSNEEMNGFLKIVAASVILFVVLFHFTCRTPESIQALPTELEEEFRCALFHVSTIISTTGFAGSSFDYVAWGNIYLMPTIFIMMLGGCAGSTAGGIKMVRLIVCIKALRNEFLKQLHPRPMLSVNLGGRVLSEERVKRTLAFLLIYVILVLAGAFLLAFMDMDIVTALGSCITALSNVGPGAGMTGPASNFAYIADPGKWLLSFYMLVGRLEIFTVLMLFTPGFYKK